MATKYFVLMSRADSSLRAAVPDRDYLEQERQTVVTELARAHATLISLVRTLGRYDLVAEVEIDTEAKAGDAQLAPVSLQSVAAGIASHLARKLNVHTETLTELDSTGSYNARLVAERCGGSGQGG